MVIYITQQRSIDPGTHEPTSRWRSEPVDVDRLDTYTLARAVDRAEMTNHRLFQTEARVVTVEVYKAMPFIGYRATVVAGGDIYWEPQS